MLLKWQLVCKCGYSGEGVSIDLLLPLFMYLYITQVLPIIFLIMFLL